MSKLYHGMKPYRFSFINPETGNRNYWIRFYHSEYGIELVLSDSERVALKECPNAHGFLIESDQDDENIRKSWGLPY